MQIKVSIVQNVGKKQVIANSSDTIKAIFDNANINYSGNTININGYVLTNSEIESSIGSICESKGISLDNIVLSSIHKYHNA